MEVYFVPSYEERSEGEDIFETWVQKENLIYLIMNSMTTFHSKKESLL